MQICDTFKLLVLTGCSCLLLACIGRVEISDTDDRKDNGSSPPRGVGDVPPS